MIAKFEENNNKSIEFDLHTQKDCLFIVTNYYDELHRENESVIVELKIEDAKNILWYFKKYLENE